MFVETYRQENSGSIMAGGDARPIPYPKISQEDWRVSSCHYGSAVFLPVGFNEHDFTSLSVFNLI